MYNTDTRTEKWQCQYIYSYYRAAICSPRLTIMAHVISHVVVLPTDWNDLERFEPRVLLLQSVFKFYFLLYMYIYRCGLAETFF